MEILQQKENTWNCLMPEKYLEKPFLFSVSDGTTYIQNVDKNYEKKNIFFLLAIDYFCIT